MIIVVTGRIGSGKDTVLNLLNIPNTYKIIDADKLGHEVLEKKSVIEKIAVQFPSAIIAGVVDRKILAKLVFPNNIKKLNCIVHPEMRAILEKLSGKVVINAALLDELKLAKLADKVIFVDKSERRIYEHLKNKFYKKDIKKRLKAQHKIMWYRKRADIIVKNNGSLEDLKKEIATKCQSLF